MSRKPLLFQMSAKRTKATIKPSPCNISGEMGEKITALLHECNIEAVVVPDVVEEPLPLLLPDHQNVGQQDTEVETGTSSQHSSVRLNLGEVYSETKSFKFSNWLNEVSDGITKQVMWRNTIIITKFTIVLNRR